MIGAAGVSPPERHGTQPPRSISQVTRRSTALARSADQHRRVLFQVVSLSTPQEFPQICGDS
jgi:hypothetical protein